MKINKLLILTLFSFISLLSACLEEKVIEDLGIVTVYGFDKVEDSEKIQATTVLFQFNPDITDASQIITSKGNTFREIRNNANQKSGYKIVSGQLRSVMFGPTLANEGIFPLLDPLERDASISDMVYVTMSTEETSEVLTATNYEQAPNIGTYIQRMIEKAIQDETIVSSTLHEYTRTYFTIGQDPLIPIITSSKNKAKIDGLAIMKDDKYVDSITLKESFYLRLLLKKFKAGQVEMELPLEVFKPYLEEYEEINKEKLYIVIDQLSSHSDIKVSSPDTLKFDVSIKLRGRIVEMSERLNLKNKKVLTLVEKQVNKEIENKINDLILKSKELQTDIFGFGKTYLASVRNLKLTKQQWREMYPNIDVGIKVDTNIRSYGIIE